MSQPPWWQWRRGDQVFVAVCLTLLLGLMIAHWGRLSGWGRHEVEIRRMPQRQYSYQLDMNRADWVEWALLEGVGETTARRIVAHRKLNGPFQNIDELDRVRGIGPATLERLRPWLTIGEGTQPQVSRVTPESP